MPIHASFADPILRDYKRVPPLRKDDKVLPSATDIPDMLSSFRYPRKGSISVGPQSEADAREMIAYREQHRRDSRTTQQPASQSIREASSVVQPLPSPSADDSAVQETILKSEQSPNPSIQSAQPSLQINLTHDLLTPPSNESSRSSDSGREEEKSDKQMFSSLEKPRIRYDVEVVTKLVVYAGKLCLKPALSLFDRSQYNTGIAWLAVEGNPLLFEALGL